MITPRKYAQRLMRAGKAWTEGLANHRDAWYVILIRHDLQRVDHYEATHEDCIRETGRSFEDHFFSTAALRRRKATSMIVAERIRNEDLGGDVEPLWKKYHCTQTAGENNDG